MNGPCESCGQPGTPYALSTFADAECYCPTCTRRQIERDAASDYLKGLFQQALKQYATVYGNTPHIMADLGDEARLMVALIVDEMEEEKAEVMPNAAD